MGTLTNLEGQQVGDLTVMCLAPRELWQARHAMWCCICHCGNFILRRGDALTRRRYKSCGCTKPRPTDTERKSLHPLFNCWSSMMQRCNNPKDRSYHNYGERGITVCEAWSNDFWQFVADMDEKPLPQHLYSIDRIDNDGNYEPGNVRWATAKEQRRNQRRSQARREAALI